MKLKDLIKLWDVWEESLLSNCKVSIFSEGTMPVKEAIDNFGNCKVDNFWQNGTQLMVTLHND